MNISSPEVKSLKKSFATPSKVNTEERLVKVDPLPVESEYASSKQRRQNFQIESKKIVLTNQYLESKQYSVLDFHDKENVLNQLKKEKLNLRDRLRIINLSIADLECSRQSADNIGIHVEQITLDDGIMTERTHEQQSGFKIKLSPVENSEQKPPQSPVKERKVEQLNIGSFGFDSLQ